MTVDSYWEEWIAFDRSCIAKKEGLLGVPSATPSYEPQFIYNLSVDHFHLLLRYYSRGDSTADLSQFFEPLLHYWEEAERLGQEVWTPEQQSSRHSWAVNLDHYVDCFWLVGLALTLEVPEAQWQRLLVLVGNEGEDLLLDRIIATRSPTRKIGVSLCYPKPYARLLEAIDAPKDRQASRLKQFVERWYKETGGAARSGREAQSIAFKAPYWHNYHRIKGAYFGYWCLEAVAAVKAFNLDDSLCVGHPHYPGDLLRPEQVTVPDVSRLLPELAAAIGAPPEPPFTGEPRHLTKWEALKMMVRNKLNP